MKVDSTDVQTMVDGFTPLVVAADDHLESLFQYLMPDGIYRTDFSDASSYHRAMLNVFQIFDLLSEVHCKQAWLDATNMAIRDHGVDATTDHVKELLTAVLAGRTAAMLHNPALLLNPDPKQPPHTLAIAFAQTITSGFGQMVGILTAMPLHDARLRSTIDKYAGVLGLEPADIYTTMRTGGIEGAEMGRKLNIAHVERLISDCKAAGQPVPAEYVIELAGLMNEQPGAQNEDTGCIEMFGEGEGIITGEGNGGIEGLDGGTVLGQRLPPRAHEDASAHH